MNEAEAAEFADPPRRWGRVGMMAGGWALVLVLGASVAPGFAASGSEENQDPRDEAATDANGAAWRYLRYGSSDETDRAEAALCDEAEPELTPDGLDAIRESYVEELGGITDVDVETEDPVTATAGVSIAGSVSYISQGGQRHESFLVTVQEEGGVYCVSEAVHVQDEEPTSGESPGEPTDPQTLATYFMRSIVVTREPQVAASGQCDSYTGITPEELDSAITEWSSLNGETTAFLNRVVPDESPEGSHASVEVEISLDGDLKQETFVFVVGVKQDCIISLEGGEGLVGSP